MTLVRAALPFCAFEVMDDHLEHPNANLSVIDEQQKENNESSDEEDEGPDWTNLPLATRAHVVRDRS